jgi:tRNA-dihydrouridine synthase A
MVGIRIKVLLDRNRFIYLNHKKVMDFIQPNSIKNIHKLSIAPMMDCTDKHFRMIMRKISSQALLYTEMIVAQSLVFTNKKENFLDFNDEEHPISIQFGGDDPKILKEAAQMAQDWGYDRKKEAEKRGKKM